MALLPSRALVDSPHSHIRNPNPSSPLSYSRQPLFLQQRSLRSSTIRVYGSSEGQNLTSCSSSVPSPPKETRKLYPSLVHFAASALLFVGFGARACLAVSGNLPSVHAATSHTVMHEERIDGGVNGTGGHLGQPNLEYVENHKMGKFDIDENIGDRELKAALERWKSKTFALTVPLRIVGLRGSIPPSWIKDFMQSQGRRLQLRSEFRGSLDDIFFDLSSSLSKGNLEPKSTMAADIVTIGDSWLSLGIKKGILEPLQGVEEQDWFKSLSEKWKVYLCRNSNGTLDIDGKIWAAPYRWGSLVIAYKKNKFQKHNVAPVEDWGDLWRPELAGKISMVDSPREIIGAVLKYMGVSYNTKDIDLQVTGGREAAMHNLALLQKQVRLFDSDHYLKAFGVGDVWVAVGWSSDVLPAAKRMSNVAVIVPKSGASLWADLWAIPAARKFATYRIGGRIRGPSPLIHQWIEFCLQAARALPFEQEVIPGSSPFSLEDPPVEGSQELTMGKPKLDTNLIAGVPPPDILAKCEFLEPLSDAALKDYQWLISSMRKPDHGWIDNVKHYISSMVQRFGLKPQST